MSKWEKFTSLGTLLAAIAAIAAVIVAVNTTQISHQTNLPIISAITTMRYDQAEGLWSEELVVNNNGFALREFDCYTQTVMEIRAGAEKRTYIPLSGYFGLGDYTGNSNGLLVSMSQKGNYSLYSSIYLDFHEEASNDGYSSAPWPYTVLVVGYEDYTRAFRREYYFVGTSGSNEISEEYAWTILDSASANRELMKSEGLSCFISTLNGTDLWHWYKGQYLE